MILDSQNEECQCKVDPQLVGSALVHKPLGQTCVVSLLRKHVLYECLRRVEVREPLDAKQSFVLREF